MSTRTWLFKPEGNPADVQRLATELNIDPSLANLLVQRGVNSFEDERRWFRPSLDDLLDPFLMKDMDKAINRLQQAIKNGEKILVYGDYDVDGTTAVSLIILFLKPRHNNVAFYIPDRYSEGYGVSLKGIQYASDNGFSLLITLDCGIKAHKQIDRARELSIDVIVCDHHHQDNTLPDAIAVLNAKRQDCQYPFKELSGCGVAFKFLQAYCLKENIPQTELYAFIDLVAISIASDIVEITSENRILAFHGIKKIIESPLVGIRAIKEIAKIGESLSVSDIVFKIGPRINAAGRIESGTMAVELLTCTDFVKAMEIVGQVNDCNEIRKNLDKQITEEALAMIARDSSYKNKTTTVVYDSSWHKGVVGIVASRLTEVHYRPTIVLTESNGKITGSARSVDGFDLHSAIEKCAEVLEHFGGHRYAAGLTLKPENLEAFSNLFEQAVSNSITPEQLIPKIKIDTELQATAINPKFFRILHQFEPFGPGNMTPVFCMKRMKDTGFSRAVGDGTHLKVNLLSPHDKIFDGIAFGMGSMENTIKNKMLDVCFALEENTWNGNTSLQLNVRDIKILESKN